MTQPYDYTRTYPPRRRVWPWIAAGAVLIMLVLCGIGLAAEDDSDDEARPARLANVPTTSPTRAARPTPAVDLGAGTPGAGCATSRLGKRFTLGTRAYVCSGPKPYTWKAVPEPKASKAPTRAAKSSKPVPRPKRTTTRPKATKPAATSYPNCTAMRRDHPAGVPKGHPAYASKHDRDRDNWACELS